MRHRIGWHTCVIIYAGKSLLIPLKSTHHMLSYWEQKQFFHHRHLVICGAGFTGLSAGIYFKRKYPNRKVLILEKDAINGGASTKNAGFACFGSPSELLADLKKSNEDEVFHLVEKRIRGLHNLRELMGDEAIGYEHLNGFELFREKDSLFQACAARLDYLNEKLQSIAGKKVYRVKDKQIENFGFNNIEHLIENSEEGQVDTGKMYASLLQMAKETGVEIFNGIRVDGFEEGKVIQLNTGHGAITCNQFLIANNGFAAQILDDSQTIPARAQVLITTPVKGLKVKGAFHLDEGFYYFRDIDGRILLGGGRNIDFKTETTTGLKINEVIQNHLEKMLRETILPGYDFQIEQRWAGIMGMGDQKQVIVKPLSENTFCAIRLSGMGLALSTLLGREVVEMME